METIRFVLSLSNYYIVVIQQLLLLTSLPVGPFWFSCSFLFVSSWS